MSKPRTIQDELASLKEDVQTLGSDVGSLLTAAKSEGVEKWDDVKGKVVDDMKKKLEALQERWSKAREFGEEKVEKVSKEVEERPLLSVLIAFVAGFFLGKIFRR